MSTFNQTGALCLALALATAGCTPPEGDFEPTNDDASLDDAPDGQSASAIVLEGSIRAVDGSAVPNAQICIEDGSACTESHEHGAFELAGLEDGLAEVIRVEADGFAPTLVPIEAGRFERYPLTVRMLHEKATPYAGSGTLQIVTQHLSAEGPLYDLQPEWTLRKGKLERTVVGSRPLAIGMQPGLWEASYEVDALCAEVTGWAGETGRSVLVPIEDGAVTQLRQICLTGGLLGD